MPAPEPRITLHSYRLAFELERRIHRIDRFRIPLPYGLPLASLGYAIGLELLVLAAAQVMVVGQVLALLPWPLRLIFLPGAGAHLLCRIRPDGRPAHEAIVASLVHRVRPKHLVAFQPVSRQVFPPDVVAVVPDERSADFLPATSEGLRPSGSGNRLGSQSADRACSCDSSTTARCSGPASCR